MKKENKISQYIRVFAAMIFCMLMAVYVVVMDNDFYSKQYRICAVDKTTGMSFEDLEKTTTVLLDYLEDKRDDLSVLVNKNGVIEEAFYERETLHMIDVKVLYLRAKAVMWTSLGIGIALIGWSLYRHKNNLSQCFDSFLGGVKFTTIIFIIFSAVIGIMVAVDFNWFWIHFHYIFFNNDLWLLDPRLSTMINMLPEELFFAMVVRILKYFITMYIAMISIFMIGRRTLKKNIPS